MYLFLCLVALLGSLVVVGFVIAWHPKAHDEPVLDRATVLDWCEYVEVAFDTRVACERPATHELAAITVGGEANEVAASSGGGGTGMVATYCAEHAPEGAVRVR